MNGRRVLIVLLSMMLFSIGASAQMVKASFGVIGGGIGTQMNTVPATTDPMYLSGYGGVFSTINMGKVLGIRVGGNYAMQGGNYMLGDVDVDVNVRQSYINIPASLLINLRSFIALEAGFYQNILLSSSYKESKWEITTFTPDEGALKYNFGALAGLTFNFGRFVFLSMRYNYGLSKSYVIHGEGYKVNTVTVGLGFNIFTTRKTAF